MKIKCSQCEKTLEEKNITLFFYSVGYYCNECGHITLEEELEQLTEEIYFEE